MDAETEREVRVGGEVDGGGGVKVEKDRVVEKRMRGVK